MKKNIEAVDNGTFDKIWKIVEEIGVQERHFNDLQARYRNMSSVWLLATFAAIGFVISNTISIDIDRELLVVSISGAGSVGIVLLWVVDLLVYHRLLDSCFVEGLILEEKYSWLPPCRNNMMKTQEKEGVLFRVVVFYLAPVVLLIIIAGGSFALWLSKEHPGFAVLCFILTIVLGVLAGSLIRSKTENTAALERRLAESRCNDPE